MPQLSCTGYKTLNHFIPANLIPKPSSLVLLLWFRKDIDFAGTEYR
jgi:hypothetical protein